MFIEPQSGFRCGVFRWATHSCGYISATGYRLAVNPVPWNRFEVKTGKKDQNQEGRKVAAIQSAHRPPDPLRYVSPWSNDMCWSSSSSASTGGWRTTETTAGGFQMAEKARKFPGRSPKLINPAGSRMLLINSIYSTIPIDSSPLTNFWFCYHGPMMVDTW